jgi:hypothetical protein
MSPARCVEFIQICHNAQHPMLILPATGGIPFFQLLLLVGGALLLGAGVLLLFALLWWRSRM